jgi:hypothetical protein
MRQRFVQVLKSEDQDSLESEVLKRFWARAKPLPARVENRPEARVVDLARWAASRRTNDNCTDNVFGVWGPGTNNQKDGDVMPLPKNYRSIEEFEREELKPSNKIGFDFDDLMQETMMRESDLLFDDQRDEYAEEDEDDDY